MIIKLDESQNVTNNYLEIDKHIYDKESEKTYENESIYILNYPNGDKPTISFGFGFNQKDEYKMKHFCNTVRGSSGGPILSLLSKKIIGIHREGIKDKDGELYNTGTFLKFPLNELNQKKEKNISINYELFRKLNPNNKYCIKELKKIPDYDKKYPLLNYFLVEEKNENNDHRQLIDYLPFFNTFVNYMIDNYSYRINRMEANNMIIEEEKIFRNNYNDFRNMFEKFIFAWEHIKNYAIYDKYNREMSIVNLCGNFRLNSFLIDENDYYYRNYLSCALNNFIEWQNGFLNELIEKIKDNEILRDYIYSLEEKINIQEAKETEILNFSEIRKNLKKIIFENTRFNNDILSFDFNSMEKYIGEIFLKGKKKFTNKYKTVTYGYEGFLGNKSGTFADFIYKYKQIELNQNILNKININHDDIEKIYISLQLIIYYLTQNIKSSQDEINQIIREISKKFYVNKECVEFFIAHNFKICELSGIYSFFELLNFDNIIKYGYYNENFREYNIPEKNKENIIKIVNENNKSFKIINKSSLSTACRKLLSRYLIRDDEINNENSLKLYLLREELWSEDIWKNEDLIEKDLQFLEENKIKVKQCYSLFKLLGEDLYIKEHNLKESNEKDNDDEYHQKIKERIRRRKGRRMKIF